VLNTYFRELLNQVEVRPLDYDYLKRLPPGPQRFYELLSFQIYGALASGRSRANGMWRGLQARQDEDKGKRAGRARKESRAISSTPRRW
jgi:hypothetical protein